MINCGNAYGHNHVTLDEMMKIIKIGAERISETEVEFLLEIEEKTDDCPECERRITLFEDALNIFGFAIMEAAYNQHKLKQTMNDCKEVRQE